MAINGVTGEFDFFPPSDDESAELARQETPSAGLAKAEGPMLGLPESVPAEDWTQAGWAVVCHQSESADVREALARLYEHRLSRFAEKRRKRCRVLEYREGEDRRSWLLRHDADLADVNPNRVPYYLLIAGSPQSIPLEFSQDLALDYAVGRLHFPDVQGYERYIESLIAYETARAVRRMRKAAFFATRHPGDAATEASHDVLMEPLLDGDAEEDAVTEASDFHQARMAGPQATADALSDLFTSDASFLMTATHGVAYPSGHPDQRGMQGALYCADKKSFGGVDLPAARDLHGLISFHFACYGAGTPSHDNFVRNATGEAPRVAREPFFARLPQAALSHAGGCALACIGHVDRCWGWSFLNPRQAPQLLPFRNLIQRILAGKPVGVALRDFAQRAASFNWHLHRLKAAEMNRTRVPNHEWADAWRYRNEAREYVLLGDPAASLRVDLLGR